MKLTIKTLQQKLFQIDVEPTESVGEIKSKIQQEHNHPVEQQKLIYSGQYLLFPSVL
jgi:UV excision repair protein RAD23